MFICVCDKILYAVAPSCVSLLQLFQTDIEYLLSMDKLWQTRTPPSPLHLAALPHTLQSELINTPTCFNSINIISRKLTPTTTES